MIKKTAEAVIYRNPHPENWTIFATLPVVEELSNDEIICVYRRGTAFMSRDGVIAKARSADGGKTWLQEGLVWDSSKDSIQYDYSGQATTKLRDGSLICVASRWDRSDPDRFFYNPKTDGYNRCEIVLFHSTDQGRSWSPPRLVKVPKPLDGISNATSPILELQSGELLLLFDTWKSYDDPNPVQQRTFMIRSTDKGGTWSDLTPVANGAAEKRYYWDGRIVDQGDGKLCILFWTRDETQGKYLPIHRVQSKDGGRTWTNPESTGIPGQTSWAVSLGGKRMLAVYSLRESREPGLMAALSEDEGKTWNSADQVRIFDALGRDLIGSSRGEGTGANTGIQAFGKPCLRPSVSGDVLLSFWCTQACVTGAHFCRLRVQ
jgi:Neuraminidase (sialidase)